jgi:alkylated DNA repair dioxygenase AlkB
VGNTCSFSVGAWSPTLFTSSPSGLEADFGRLDRHELGDGAWVDHQAGWLAGAAELFERLVTALDWSGRRVPMYGAILDQPRLTAAWPGPDLDPLAGPLVERARDLLSEHYGMALHGPGANLYRDGRDSVAWHGDRVARERHRSLVAIVSLGEARPFRLRPVGGGASTSFELGHGDLLVMGGTAQRTWQHCVPKLRRAGPRLSLTFRDTTATTRSELSFSTRPQSAPSRYEAECAGG